MLTIGDATLRESAEKLVVTSGEGPSGFPGPVRQEIRDTLKLLRQEATRARIDQLRTALAEAAQEGDAEAVRALTAQLPPLYEQLRAFDPPRSPYFRDTRTVVEKR